MADEPREGRQAVDHGRRPLVALATTQALESGERQSLAQAIDGIQDEFDVSDTQLGLLPTAMTFVGTIGSVPFGILADRTKRTMLLAGAMLVWTAVMGLNAVAPTFALLFIARLGVGAVEANGPAAISLMADYYPVRVRAKMLGLYQSGALLGGLLGVVGGGIAVQVADWRWAFAMWVPAGVLVTIFVARLAEPRRGDQDADFELEQSAPPPGATDAVVLATRLDLPEPTRVGSLDYDTATNRDVVREILAIRSMWLGVFALTISQLLLASLQHWGVEFFKRSYDLDAAEAGLFVGLFALGAAVGVFTGGIVADSFLRKGIVNARVYVVSAASIAATVLLVPAFLSPNLLIGAPLFIVGGMMLTVPIAPGEAMVSDVVVAQLRGRAATVRSIVRSLAALGPALVGVLSDAFSLSTALALLAPAYAVGGVVVLLAAKTYPADLAFVAAESRRIREKIPDRER